MIKLIYINSSYGPEMNIVEIYSSDIESVIDFIDANLLGTNIDFSDVHGHTIGMVTESDTSCDDAIRGYHEPDEDLMVDYLQDDPEFDSIDTYSMEVYSGKITSDQIINKIRTAAASLGIKLIED